MGEYSSASSYRDYTVGGPESKLAVEKGLASGQWFVPRIERATLKRLMRRDDYHALCDTAILAGLLAATGYASCRLWAEGCYRTFAVMFWVYCTLYTSSGDSRWHECGHGTAFKTRWMNDLLYEVASFMVFREPLVWRFSHARHHTDTDIVGRDPEVDGRPLSMTSLALAFLNYQGITSEAAKLWMHAGGRLSAPERTFVPASEHGAVCRQARLWLAAYALTVAAAVAWRSPLPCMFVFLPYAQRRPNLQPRAPAC
jgi:fatty acid desaturase